jgi:hypothetical protein
MVCFQTKYTNLGKFWSVVMEDVSIFYGPFGQFYGHLAYFKAFWYTYFMVIWYVLPVLVSCGKKNLATLRRDSKNSFFQFHLP